LFVWVGGVGKVLVTLLKDKKANTIPTPFKKSRRENFFGKNFGIFKVFPEFRNVF